ncbi:hypothetical protein [Fonticella tunisiensis]|uniref:Uncharacterized protein n=1 Tax=Fonticella tunisiensis TaxID=1096341 RepID=A0A4R7KUX7_9CLOT|nr:hypothetical protein [Fonticella tunisiensis]TDT63412.1 hypothetical protein EDD71_102174 [Fonticella tunisiensis]
MKLGQVLREKQPNEYRKLNKRKKKERKAKEHLSFYDILELMKHDSYERHRGALRQRY